VGDVKMAAGAGVENAGLLDEVVAVAVASEPGGVDEPGAQGGTGYGTDAKTRVGAGHIIEREVFAEVEKIGEVGRTASAKGDQDDQENRPL